MIGQYLSNTNEIGTIHILPKILELNKALAVTGVLCHGVMITVSVFLLFS